MRAGSLWRRLIAIIVTTMTVASAAEGATEPVTIRMGYQTLYSPIAEVYTALRHTKILETNGLKGEFIPFTYAGAMPEAIAAGLLDAAYGGWMPALSFFKAGPNWRLVSNIHDFEWYVIVRDPEVQGIQDLRGKTLGVAFGAQVQFTAIEMFRLFGITDDIKFINIEAGGLVNAMEIKAVDGIVVWQGAISARILGLKLGKALPIQGVDRLLTGVQALSGDFIQKHPEASVGFLRSLMMAFSYASKNRDKVMEWYLKDHPQAKIPKSDLETFWATDRHLKKGTELKDVDLRITEKDFGIGQATADLAHELGFLPKFNVRALWNQELMERAYGEIQAGKYALPE